MKKTKSTVVYVNAKNMMISVKNTGCLIPMLSIWFVLAYKS